MIIPPPDPQRSSGSENPEQTRQTRGGPPGGSPAWMATDTPPTPHPFPQNATQQQAVDSPGLRAPGRGRRRMVTSASAVVLAVSSGIIGGLIGVAVDSNDVGQNKTSTSDVLAQSVEADASVIQNALQSTVTVRAGNSSGSGVLISEDGKILTNNHVVSETRGDNVAITLSNEKTVSAEIIKTDPDNDLALLQTNDDQKYQSLGLGDSSNIHIGAPVYAIGSPFGLEGSVTQGIISATNRSLTISSQQRSPGSPSTANPDSERLTGLLQTDAAINPGSSGGALIDIKGKIVGINTAIAGETNAGIGFAIPVSTIRAFL